MAKTVLCFILICLSYWTVAETVESLIGDVVTHDYKSNYILMDLFEYLSSNTSLVSTKCLSHMSFLKNSIDTRKIWAVKGMCTF